MPRTGFGPVYLVAEASLDKPSAISFPRMPQCLGVHTSRTLLCTDSSARAQTATRAEFTFGVISAFITAWLSEHKLQLTHCFCSVSYKASHIVILRKSQLGILIVDILMENGILHGLFDYKHQHPPDQCHLIVNHL